MMGFIITKRFDFDILRVIFYILFRNQPPKRPHFGFIQKGVVQCQFQPMSGQTDFTKRLP